jgi:hypothetical protein
MTNAYYRCEWKPYRHSVCVQILRVSGDTCPEGYHTTEVAARKAIAAEMNRIAGELMRESDALLRDERSRG